MAGSGAVARALEGSLDGAGREPEFFGGLLQADQVGALAVGAGQLTDLLQPERPAVVQREHRQGGRPTVTLIFLANEGVARRHVVPFLQKKAGSLRVGPGNRPSPSPRRRTEREPEVLQ